MDLLGRDQIYYLVDRMDLMAYCCLSYFLPLGYRHLTLDLETEDRLHQDLLAFLVVIVDSELESGILHPKGHLVFLALDFEQETFCLSPDLY